MGINALAWHAPTLPSCMLCYCFDLSIPQFLVKICAINFVVTLVLINTQSNKTSRLRIYLEKPSKWFVSVRGRIDDRGWGGGGCKGTVQ